MAETHAKKRKRNTGRRRGGRGGSPGGEERGEALADALATMRGLQKEMGGLRRRVGELEAGKKKADGKIASLTRELRSVRRGVKRDVASAKESIRDDLHSVKHDCGTNKSSIGHVERMVGYVERDVERLEERLESRADALEGRLDDVHDRTGERVKSMSDLLVEHVQTKIECVKMDVERLESDVTTFDSLAESRARRIENEIVPLREAVKYHRALVRNDNWENPVHRVSSSYWTANGYTDIEADAMRALVRKIRDETRYMRTNGSDGRIKLRVQEAGNGVIPHDDVMLPHWEEFALALEAYRHFVNSSELDESDENSASGDTKPSFTLGGIQVSNQVLELLKAALDCNFFKTLYLVNNLGGRDIVSFAISVLASNECLENLHFINNAIQEDDFADLVGVVSGHASLRTLDLQFSCRGLGFSTITTLLTQCSCFHIDLSNNAITTRGDASFLGDFLETNSTLLILQLANNGLNDFDAESLARGLKTNSTLVALQLRDNDFTEAGRRALLGAVFDPLSLNATDGLNHSCAIYCDGDLTDELNLYDSRYNRSQKLYCILSSRNRENSNVSQLGDDVNPMHMPRLLQSTQHFSAEVPNGRVVHDEERFEVVPPLSIVHEILRGSPGLFEFHQGPSQPNSDE